MRERAEVLRQNLRSSHEKAIAEILPKIQEMAASQTKLAKPHRNFVSSIGAADVIKNWKIMEASDTG
jgi:hypothetical protein